MSEKQQHLHVIGICGVATSAIAIAFHKKGWKVTGSDKGFFPPVSTELTDAGVEYYAGWHPEKMIAGGIPDLILAGTASGTQNPETKYATEHNIPIKSDAEMRGEYFAREHSIVCAGTWGKTSTTALLSHIFIEAKRDPSYIIGGLSLSSDAAHLGDSPWSIIEGDEYKSSPWDNRPKFAHIKTTHLLLTAVSWDHADLYPTEELYFKTFENYANSIPKDSLIVYCADDAGTNTVTAHATAKKVSYGHKENADYFYHSISHTKKGLSFIISHDHKDYTVASPMLGRFNAENITGAFAMAVETGISPEVVIDAIHNFKGIKRRLEKRYEGDVTVLDCHAPTAEKAASVLESIREVYDKKIIVIFEPNIGGRRFESASKYDGAFNNADLVIIPRLTKLKVTDDESDRAFDAPELTAVISKTQPNTKNIDDDTALIEAAISEAKKGDVIAFLGSHGFRGMIEATIEKLTLTK